MFQQALQVILILAGTLRTENHCWRLLDKYLVSASWTPGADVCGRLAILSQVISFLPKCPLGCEKSMSSLGDYRPYQGVAVSMASSLGLASVRALHQFPDVWQNVEGTEQCQYPLTVPMLTAKKGSSQLSLQKQGTNN